MLILHVSDTHLGAMPYGLVSRARDVYEAFKETVDIALKERVSIYLHAGDFFDSPNPPPESYIIAYRELKKLKESGIRTVVISGQHDIPRRHAISPLYLLQDLGVIDVLAINSVSNKTFEYPSLVVSIYAVPYGLRSLISKMAVSKEGNRNILIAHLLLRELGIPSEEADISLNHIPKGFTYIALGDYHVKTELRHVDGAPAIYPGATEIHRENECCDKYVALVDLGPKEPIVNFLKLKSVRPWVRVRCADASLCVKELSEIVHRIDSSKRPIVSVELLKIGVEVITRILNEMINKGVIEYYRIKVADEGGILEGSMVKMDDVYEYIDLDKIIQNIIKHENLALLISRYVKEPTRQIADEIIQFLKNNVEAVKALEMSSTYSSAQYRDSNNNMVDSVRNRDRKDSVNRRASLLSFAGENR
ncbi:MAG: DNA repair exonuclease [Ignisphaera sp.]